MAFSWSLDGVLHWGSVDDWIIVAKQKALEWYEYAEAQRQIAVLNARIRVCEMDLESFPLSAVGRRAIEDEIKRLRFWVQDMIFEWGIDE